MNAQRNRSILLWLAALAMLWGMLAPALAMGAAHQGKAPVEVCMAVGIRLVALDATASIDGAAQDQAPHAGMHCPACVSPYDLAIVAHPPGSLTLLAAPAGRILVRQGPAVPPAAAIHAAHRCRAPPLPA